MNESIDDVVTYMIVLRGLDEAAHDLFSKRFPAHRGGVSPGPHPREVYQVLDCDLNNVSDALSWIVRTISGHFRVVELGVHIHTVRNWANFDFPAEVVHAACQFGATLRVSFMSPARGWSPSTSPHGA
jgi:hypothetical protein